MGGSGTFLPSGKGSMVRVVLDVNTVGTVHTSLHLLLEVGTLELGESPSLGDVDLHTKHSVIQHNGHTTASNN